MKIKILFGEMGSGKTYKGKKLAENYGFDFLEGDSFLTKEMNDRVNSFKPLTKEMIDDFVKIHLFRGIIKAGWKAEQKGKRGLIVAQALYLDSLRVELKSKLIKAGYEVEFVKIETPFFTNMRQLWSRKFGMFWILYWLMNKPFFQNPTHSYTMYYHKS